MAYVVISENEIVKVEMEKQDKNIYDENGNLFWTWGDYLLSLPRIAAPGHKWKLWSEVVHRKHFLLEHQVLFSGTWSGVTKGAYDLCEQDHRRIIAIPIQKIIKKMENDITDFFARFGVKEIQRGSTKITVPAKKLKEAKRKSAR